MATYTVDFEIHGYYTVDVEARSEEEAKNKADDEMYSDLYKVERLNAEIISTNLN